MLSIAPRLVILTLRLRTHMPRKKQYADNNLRLAEQIKARFLACGCKDLFSVFNQL